MKNLIEKYFEGETSLHEEAELKAYFNSDEVEASLQQYIPLFQFFDTEKELQLSADFDEKLFEQLEEEEVRIVPMRNWKKYLMRVAAIAAVLFGAYLFFNSPNSEPDSMAINWNEYEITEEQMAYEETLKALQLLSSKLNKVKSKTAKEISKSEPATKYLN